MKTDFASTLVKLRREAKLSQKKAAEDLGISQALLSHYENGIREPRLEFVTRACEYYGVSADYILGRSNLKTLKGKVALDCTGDDQRRIVDAAALIIAILSEADDELLSGSVSKYIGLVEYNVLSALCAPTKMYEPLFDAALKTAEASFVASVRRVWENDDTEAKLLPDYLRGKYPKMFEAYDKLSEIVKSAVAGMKI